MTTYTIAYDGVLFATIPDGADMDAALDAEEDRGNIEIDRDALTIVSGLTLTNDEPHGLADVVWRGTTCGHLMDENGKTYQYAVRQ